MIPKNNENLPILALNCALFLSPNEGYPSAAIRTANINATITDEINLIVISMLCLILHSDKLLSSSIISSTIETNVENILCLQLQIPIGEFACNFDSFLYVSVFISVTLLYNIFVPLKYVSENLIVII